MRKNILGLLVLLFIGNNALCREFGEVVDVLTSTERKDLKIFFGNCWYKNESYLEALDSFMRDYLISLVSRHIIILENKIAQNKSAWKSSGVFKGAGWLSGSAIGQWIIYKGYQDFATGSFGHVEISDYQMNNLLSMKFSRSERKKQEALERAIKANGGKITIIPVLSSYWYRKIQTCPLSDKEKDKFFPLLLRQACRNTYQGMFIGLGLTVVCLGMAAYQFYKVTRSSERLVERLERDKRVLALLENQRDMRLGRIHSNV